MIQLLLGLPVLDVGGFSVYANDAAWAELGAMEYEAGGSVYADIALVRLPRAHFVLFTGANLDTLRFTVPDQLTMDATTWSFPLEVGPRWEWGEGKVRGFADLGLGAQLRLALPDYVDGVGTLAASTHGSIGAVFAAGKVRPLVEFRTEGAFATASLSGDILIPDGSVSVHWTAGSVRATLLLGVRFGDGGLAG